jgi:hypothetical protein
VKLRLKRDTAANLAVANPTLDVGEPCFAVDTNTLKIGDGVTPYNSLPTISGEGGGGGEIDEEWLQAVLDGYSLSSHTHGEFEDIILNTNSIEEIKGALDGYATVGDLSSHTGDSSIHFTAASLNLDQYATGAELHSALDGYSPTSHTHTQFDDITANTNSIAAIAGVLDGYATAGDLSSHTSDSSIHFTAASLNLDQYIDAAELHSALDGYSPSSHTHTQFDQITENANNISSILDALDGYAAGEAENGIPTGGTAGQLLAKIDGTNYNAEWVDPPSGGGLDLAELNPILDGYATVSHTHTQFDDIIANTAAISNIAGVLDGYATASSLSSHTSDSSIHFTAASLNLSQYATGAALDGYVKTSTLETIIDDAKLVGSLAYNIILNTTFEQALASTSQQNVTGLSFTPLANKRYMVTAHLLLQTSNASNGPRPGAAIPGGTATTVGYNYTSNNDTASATRYYRNAASFAASTGLALADSTTYSQGSWLVTSGSTPTGNFTITLGKELASDTARMMAGSYLRVEVINEGIDLGYLTVIFDGYAPVDHTHTQFDQITENANNISSILDALDGYAAGEAENGIPTGGTAGQLLAKVDNTNYNAEWIDPPSGGGLDLAELNPILDGYATTSDLSSHTGDSTIHFTAASLNLDQYIDAAELHSALDGYSPTSHTHNQFDDIITNTNSIGEIKGVLDGYATAGDLSSHTGDSSIHFTAASLNLDQYIDAAELHSALDGYSPTSHTHTQFDQITANTAIINDIVAALDGYSGDGGGEIQATTTIPKLATLLYTNNNSSFEHNNSSAESAALHSYTLGANNYDYIVVDATMVAYHRRDLNTAVTYTYRIKEDGYTWQTVTEFNAANSAAGTDGGNIFSTFVRGFIPGGQTGNVDINVTGQMAGLVHADVRVYCTNFAVYGIKDHTIHTAVPTGGTTGQVLAKTSNDDGDFAWADPIQVEGLDLQTLDEILDGYSPIAHTHTQFDQITANTAIINDIVEALDGYSGGGGDPSRQFAEVLIQDHFVTTGLNQNYTWRQDIGGSGSNTPLTTPEQSAYGIMRMSTGGDTTGRASLWLGPTSGNNIRLGGGLLAYDWQARVRINYVADGTNTYEMHCGLTTSVGSGSEVHSISFVINNSSANWICRTNDNFNVTNTGSGVAVATNTWVYLRFTVNAAADEAKFYINGTLVATVTSNIPTSTTPYADGLNLGQRIVKSAGTTAANFDIDFISLRIYEE